MSCRTLQGKYAEKLEERINKAIEYIEEDLYEVGGNVHGSDLPFSALEPLLEILEGKDDRE